jgi:chromosomal replication initiator protein
MENTKPFGETPDDFWRLVLDDLRLQMTRVTFTTWLQSTRALGLANGTLSIRVRNQATQEWLENRLDRKIRDTVDYFSAAPLEIRFVTDQNPPEREP